MVILIMVFCLFRICFATEFGHCYEDLGCFPNDYPWFSVLRPFPPPQPPGDINVKMYLCTRRNPYYKRRIDLRPSVYIPPEADFRKQRRFNTFIIHGYANNGNFSWIEQMKNAYLKRRDAHVFMVDWGEGALTLSYFQAASNTRVVGAEIARFLEYCVKNYRLNLNGVHLIGHSLGAHIAGYCGKFLNGKIGRITGLDPAQPGFEDTDPLVRLDETDAQFVEVLHTDTKPFVMLGLGMILPVVIVWSSYCLDARGPCCVFGWWGVRHDCVSLGVRAFGIRDFVFCGIPGIRVLDVRHVSPMGHVDIYANGGINQPGCPINTDNLNLNIRKIEDLGKFNLYTIGSIVSCAHLRSLQYYTEALESDCIMWARMANLEKKNLRISNGIVIPIAPVTSVSRECSIKTCVPLGIDLQLFPARGIFSMKTRHISPYCISETDTTRFMFIAKRYFHSLGSLAEFLFPKRYEERDHQ